MFAKVVLDTHLLISKADPSDPADLSDPSSLCLHVVLTHDTKERCRLGCKIIKSDEHVVAKNSFVVKRFTLGAAI